MPEQPTGVGTPTIQMPGAQQYRRRHPDAGDSQLATFSHHLWTRSPVRVRFHFSIVDTLPLASFVPLAELFGGVHQTVSDVADQWHQQPGHPAENTEYQQASPSLVNVRGASSDEAETTRQPDAVQDELHRDT